MFAKKRTNNPMVPESMIRGRLACLLLLFPVIIAAQSAYKNVLILDRAPGRYSPCEPSIAIDPNDPKNMVGGAVLSYVFHSLDSGKTWTNNKLNSRYGVFGDPCIVADDQGRFHYFHLSNPSGMGWSSAKLLDRIVSQTSFTVGQKWSRGAGIGLAHPKDQDKEWAHWDPVRQRLLLTWTQFDLYNSQRPEDKSNILFSSSADGKEWTEPTVINQYPGNCLDNSYTTEGAVPTSGPDGEFYVAWSFEGKIWFDRSLDAGTTWLDQDLVAVDDGAMWEFSIPGIGRANGMPVTGCDRTSGPHRGDIYINWADQRNGEDDTDIWFVKSNDGGNTWTKPLRVNDDGPGHHQFFTWMSVDQSTGNIFIVFYDRRNYSDNRTDVYLATSRDGGNTFTNERISDSPFNPSPSVFFGDYNNIASVNGVVRPIWTRNDDGKLSIWTALIQIP